jgi:hypothetical protein
LTLAGLPAASRPPGVSGQTRGDAVKPVPQRGAPADVGGPLGEDEKGGLEGVLGIFAVAQESLAHTQDQGPVAGDQRGEGFFVPASAVQIEKLVVGPLVGQSPHQVAQWERHAVARPSVAGRPSLGIFAEPARECSLFL